MAQQIKISVTIGGESLAPLLEVNISQDIHQHHTFELYLAADAFRETGRAILEQSKKYIGKECHIQFAPDLFISKQKENEFTGIITEVRLSRLSNGTRTVLLQGFSPTILLEGHPQCRTFTNMKLTDIAESALEAIPHSLSTKIGTKRSSELLPYTVQYDESNYAFLQRMANRFGEWCFYDGQALVFGELPRDSKIDLPLVEHLFNLDVSFKVLPVNFSVSAYDYLNSTVYQSSGAQAHVANLDDYGKFALEQSNQLFSQEPSRPTYQSMASQQELDDFAEVYKTGSANSLVMMQGTSDDPSLNVGTIINIISGNKNEQGYGEFIITSLSHHIGSSLDYQNSFAAVPAELESPPPLATNIPSCEAQSATVVDNKDPDKLGRVKVTFPWQDSKSSESTPWIRVAQTYGGGKHHGFYFVPETGTEVLVGFEHNNPEKPFVLSSMYNKDFNPSAWANGGNTMKVIKTRSGNQIHLIDGKDQEKIRIFHKKGDEPHNEICLEMEGDGKITIKSEGFIDIISAKSINMEAGEDIAITAGKNLSVAVGSDMVVDVTGDMEETAANIQRTANRSVGISAGTEVTIDGGMSASVTGGTEVKIDGGAKATVKGGANLDLEGGVAASLKGAIVKIN